MRGFSDLGPPLTIGPRVDRSEATEASPHSTRRQRRLDVWLEDGTGHVDAHLRDSHVDGDGTETIVHEYSVRARVDLSTQRFVAAAAVPGALPFPECPSAAASADRLVDAPVAGVRDWVADTFTGPPTCTHLNDQFRSLEDIGRLLALLGEELER